VAFGQHEFHAEVKRPAKRGPPGILPWIFLLEPRLFSLNDLPVFCEAGKAWHSAHQSRACSRSDIGPARTVKQDDPREFLVTPQSFPGLAAPNIPRPPCMFQHE